MNNSKKRFLGIISAILVLCMIMALIPAGLITAYADTITHDIASGVLNATGDNHYIVTQSEASTANNIVVARDFAGVITLKGVNISAASPVAYAGGAGDLTADYIIELDGANKLTSTAGAAIPTLRGATVTIQAKESTDDDSLEVWGFKGPAIGAINTPAGAVVINSGNIIVRSASDNNIGIGVSGGGCGDTFELTINGGKINVSGISKTAIGSGGGTNAWCSIGRITINGGDITAVGGHGNPAIGGLQIGGNMGGRNEIVINGGNITAQGGAFAPAIGFACNSPSNNPTPTLNTAVGKVVITGGNIKATGGSSYPAIGAFKAYDSAGAAGSFASLDSLVILPGANISRNAEIGVTAPTHFQAGVSGTAPLIGNAKNMFYMNEYNIASVGVAGATPAPLTVNAPHTNINVFLTYVANIELCELIYTAYARRGDEEPTPAFDLGITDASGNISLYYYNNMVNLGTGIFFSGSGCIDEEVAAIGAAVTLADSGSAAATATPVPTPTPAPIPSNNSKLAGLSYTVTFGEKTTVPGFLPAHDGASNVYNVVIPEGNNAVYIEAPAAHGKATASVSPSNSVPIIDGIGTATVTVTAQDTSTSTFTINFTSTPVSRTADVVRFTNGHAGSTSGNIWMWNGWSNSDGMPGSTTANSPNPDSSANFLAVKMTGDGANLRKNWLDIRDEVVISTTVYAKAGSAAVNLNFADNTLIAIDGTDYTFDGAKTMAEGWRRLDLHVAAGSGATLTDKWANAKVRLYIDGEFIAERAYPVTYVQTVLSGDGRPYSGWGSQASRFEFRLTSAGNFYFDNVFIYEPGDFIIEEAIVERYADTAKNVKLDGKVTLKLNHDLKLDAGTTELKIYENSAEITRPIAIDPLNPNRIVVDFSGTAMQQHTYYSFVLDEGATDVTGRTIEPESATIAFTTGGAEGDMPAAIPTIDPAVGEAFIMPDEFNTGYTSDFADLKPIMTMYPQLAFTPANGQVKITNANVAAMKAQNNPNIKERDGKTVISGFILEYGYLSVEASNVIIEDFLIDAKTFVPNITNIVASGGATGIVIQDGELTGGDGVAVIGDNVTLKRLNIHHIKGDGLKPSNNWWVESCYLHNFGLGYLDHADGVQISGDRYSLTNDIRMYGNRIDMPVIPYIHVANAAIFLSLDFGPLTNVDIQYNWINGAGNAVILSGHYDTDKPTTAKLLGNLTYKNNLMGVGYRWGHAGSATGGNVVNADVEVAKELQEDNLPTLGSLLYKDNSGSRIDDLADTAGTLTVMANFANFTVNEQNVKIVAELYDMTDTAIASANPTVAPIPKYTLPGARKKLIGTLPNDNPTTGPYYYTDEINKYVDAVTAYLNTNGYPGITITGSEVEHRAGALAPYYDVIKDTIVPQLNADPSYKAEAKWLQMENSPNFTWFIGLKEIPYLPLSEQREVSITLPRAVAGGDYVKVSVYGGADMDELLREDILLCSLEPAELPEFKVSNLSISGSGTYNISANVLNTYTTTKDVNFIVAAYDGNKLLDIKVIPKTIPVGQTGAYSVGSYTPAVTLQPANTVKVMAWDANQSPLCAAYSAAVSAIPAI